MPATHKVALLVSAAAALALAAAGAFTLYVELKPVHDEDIAASVASGVGGSTLSLPSCPERHDRRWRCVVDDSEASGNASTYSVRLRRDRRCWSATREQSSYVNPVLKRRADGCVGFWDKVHVFD